LAPEAARERAAAARLEAASTSDGPAIHAAAPDFELADAAAKNTVRLSDLWSKAPVVLVFGSYTCPNFRASADALNALYEHYDRQVRFFLVYIREAHATNSWQSTRNERNGIALDPANTMGEKQAHAAMCSIKLHLRFPALVDKLHGRVEAAYAAWPSRAFVIGTDGRIRYSTRLTQLDFTSEDMESALRAAIASK
jgi:thiol-disulfide isomerase/thioredoxin